MCPRERRELHQCRLRRRQGWWWQHTTSKGDISLLGTTKSRVLQCASLVLPTPLFTTGLLSMTVSFPSDVLRSNYSTFLTRLSSMEKAANSGRSPPLAQPESARLQARATCRMPARTQQHENPCHCSPRHEPQTRITAVGYRSFTTPCSLAPAVPLTT